MSNGVAVTRAPEIGSPPAWVTRPVQVTESEENVKSTWSFASPSASPTS